MLTPFKASHPEFYAHYKAARRIVRPGTAAGVDSAKVRSAQPTTVPKAA